ncbi:hypothetical protein GCM10009347_35630 [Shewanella algicola]|uniref:DUF7281 domain-containing protein n=1 Tax=Shewanella algicola TaxID=640633 RepID=A0A9X1Z7N6_9GAMM|nr:hypothetical protein [Shewanella algicola]MCL1107280.1 hypothetical protein [Shewanella algicola]GGP67066.1 hypothetical protein GCM10009347_35630 [Shewanella algicola]
MASLSQSQLQLIARAAKQLLPRVPLNASWKKLYQLWQIGEPDGAEKYLYLTHKDYALLRKMAQVDSGLDILALDFDVPRQQMAQHSANEKYANISPDADYVLIKLAPNITQSLVSKSVADNVLDVLTALDNALRLKVDTAVTLCQQLKISQLIVVENLDSFDNLFAYSFTPELQPIIDNCMVLYRGSHDYSPAGRKRFLHLIAALKLDVIAFTDLDPAGLMIANTLENCHSMIVPKLVLDAPNELLALKQVNSVSDFNKQHKQLTYLDNIMSQSTHNTVAHTSQWLTLTQWVGRNHVSIKQQHMLANALRLDRINIDY